MCECVCLYLDIALSYFFFFFFFVSHICIAWPLYLCLYPFNDFISCDYTTDYWFIKFEHLSLILQCCVWKERKVSTLCTNGVYKRGKKRWWKKSQPTTSLKKKEKFDQKRRQPLKNSFDMTDGMISRIISDLFPSRVGTSFLLQHSVYFSSSFVLSPCTPPIISFVFLIFYKLLQILNLLLLLYRKVDWISHSCM